MERDHGPVAAPCPDPFYDRVTRAPVNCLPRPPPGLRLVGDEEKELGVTDVTRQHRTRLAMSLLAVPLLFGALSACGGNEQSGDGVATVNTGTAAPKPSTSEQPATDRQERWLQFTKCLRDQGIDVQDPGPEGGLPRLAKGTDPAKRKAAMGACRQFAPGILSGGSLSPEDKQRALDYITCLREKGIQISDPDPKTGLPQRKDFAKFRNPDEAMKTAQKACQDKLPEGLGGGA